MILNQLSGQASIVLVLDVDGELMERVTMWVDVKGRDQCIKAALQRCVAFAQPAACLVVPHVCIRLALIALPVQNPCTN